MSEKMKEVWREHRAALIGGFSFFRELSAEEEKEYTDWARANYTPGSKINVMWHPVVQEECEAMNREAGLPERP